LSQGENEDVFPAGLNDHERIAKMLWIMTSRAAGTRVSLLALAVVISGCGGEPGSPEPGKITKPEEVATALPSGITLETPVVGDKRYGESSKTVADALGALNAQVKDGVLAAGFVGGEIQFDGDPKAKSKTPKPAKKGAKPPVVIHLAK
jgi:hypothetical protein